MKTKERLMPLEKRTLAKPLEIRADDKKKKIGGYAAVFNSQADIGDYFREIIVPGAFAKTIKGDVRALLDHDSGRVIGRTTAKTLRLKEDDIGLAVEIDLPDTSDGRDIATLIERGDISGMSFGFMVTKQTWDETGDIPVRTIEEVELLEVSVVAFPAYDDTTIAMRSLEAIRKERSTRNFNAAARRISARKAAAEAKFRKIS
jgi:HK97 family phage prohead protease